MTKSSAVTKVLAKLDRGDPNAAQELLPLVYAELRSLAKRYFRAQSRDHTLQPTALVHEAYARLAGGTSENWKNRAHFLAVAAQAMRQILVDHARKRRTTKRGGDQPKFSLDDARDQVLVEDQRLIALDEALERLGDLDPLRRRIVELRFFGGLTVKEAAHVLDVSPRSVDSGWSFAKAWLHREMTREG